MIALSKIFRRCNNLYEWELNGFNLFLEVDESFGRYMILECRHERRKLEGKFCRT